MNKMRINRIFMVVMLLIAVFVIYFVTGAYANFTANLKNGDSNGDDGVDEIDYALLSNAWYQAYGDPAYNDAADLNGDAGVDEMDYAIQSNSWYLAGDGDIVTSASSITGTPKELHFVGTINLKDWQGTGENFDEDACIKPIIIRAKNQSTGYVYENTDEEIDLEGNTSGQAVKQISMYVPVQDHGAYDVTIKVWHWLSALVSDVNTIPTVDFSINDGATATNSQNVHLDLTAEDYDGGSFYSGNNNLGISNTSSIVYDRDFTTSAISWSLTAGEGTKTIYVQVKDNTGQESRVISKSIVYDVTLPTPGTATCPSYANYTPIPVSYTNASDALSGLAKLELWYKSPSPYNYWQKASEITNLSSSGSFEFTPPYGYGTYYFDLVAVDKAQNSSAAASGDGDCHVDYEDFAKDWTMFMHDPQHTGRSTVSDSLTATSLRNGPTWSASINTAYTTDPHNMNPEGTWSDHNQPGGTEEGWIFEHPFIDSSPVVVGNKVIVGGWDEYYDYFDNSEGYVKAFDADDGDPRWTASVSPSMGGVASTPCVVKGKVYVGSANGYLYCLDLEDGDQLWAQSTTNRTTPTPGASRILASPVVHDGIVYVGNEAAKVYAFNAENGTPISGWPVVLPIDDPYSERAESRRIINLATKNMTGVSSAAIATVASNTYLIFGCDDGYIYRITLGVENPQNTLEDVDLGHCVESSPTVVDDMVYVGTSHFEGDQVYGISIPDFDEIYVQNDISGQECRATLAYDGNGYFFAGVDTGWTFHEIDASDLTNAVDEFGSEPPYPYYFVGSAALCGNGLAYIGNDDGFFRALAMSDLSPGSPERKYPTSGTYGTIRSSAAIAYNVGSGGDRWIYITRRVFGITNAQLCAFHDQAE